VSLGPRLTAVNRVA